MARNFPFQAECAGSQTSILMSESEEGFRVAATRQCVESGSAEVITVPAGASVFSCSHGVCARAAHVTTK